MDKFILDSFAAAAAKAATLMTLTGMSPGKVRVVTTKKDTVTINIDEAKVGIFESTCSVLTFCRQEEKPLRIIAKAKRLPIGYVIVEENGISVCDEHSEDYFPRIPLEICKSTVTQAVASTCHDCNYAGGIKITLSLLDGAQIPESLKHISENADIVTRSLPIEATPENILEAFSQLKDNRENTALLAPVDYGRDYIEKVTGYAFGTPVLTGDYLSFAIKNAKKMGFKGVLIVSHLEKAIKFVNGIYETSENISFYIPHVFTAYAALEGASVEELNRLINCKNTEEAMDELKKSMCYDQAVKRLLKETEQTLNKKFPDICIGIIAFSPKHGLVYKSSQVPLLINLLSIK